MSVNVPQKISNKVEKFIVEGTTFKNAVREAFLKADLDNNGVISPKEVAAMSDTMFDLVEKELKEYGIPFKRPTPEQTRELLDLADRNKDYVLDQNEFFDFYKSVVKYSAVIVTRGWTRVIPKMAIGLFLGCVIGCGVPKFSGIGTNASPALKMLPLCVGPAVGLVAGLYGMDYGNKKLKDELFAAEEAAKKDKAKKEAAKKEEAKKK